MLRRSLESVLRAARSFHEDDRGVEVIESVMLVAVAAMMLMAVTNMATSGGESGKGWMGQVGGLVSGVLGGGDDLFGGFKSALGF